MRFSPLWVSYWGHDEGEGAGVEMVEGE